MSNVQDMNVVTSLDFSLPDPESESAKVSWPDVLKKVLPFTDIFAPSLEEALLIMMPREYARIQSSIGDADLLDLFPVETIREVGKRIIESGAYIALINAGHRGAYLWAGDISSLNEKPGFHLPVESWNNSELWCKAYPVDEKRVKNASGAGDTSVAAFLSAILDGKGPESSLRYAALAGRNNLYCYDIFNEINSWEEMTEEIQETSVESGSLKLIVN